MIKLRGITKSYSTGYVFRELNGAGTTIVQVTHSELNAGYGRRTIHLLDGWVQALGH